MAEVKWIKITTDMFDNRKIKYIRKLPEGDSIVLIWVMLLTMAGRCNAGGKIYLTEDIPYNAKMLANELDFEENTVILALGALESLNMIDQSGEHITIQGWEEHQNVEGMDRVREQNRLRKQRQRERAKLAASNDCHVTVAGSHAIEEEGEEEKEEEKEYSIYLSGAEKNGFGEFSTEFSTKQRDKAKQHLLQGSLGQGVVFISDEQIEDLLDKLSMEEFDHYVKVVADCILAGKRYKKTHYQAILDMATKDRWIK